MAYQTANAEGLMAIMGNVVISPNIKKTTARIDSAGNIIDKNTHQIIEPVDVPYQPTPEQVNALINKGGGSPISDTVEEPQVIKPTFPSPSNPPPSSLEDKIQKMIEAKIDKIVEKKIDAILNKL